MKVFLTGGSGYIGSRVARALVSQGCQVLGLARNDIAAQKLLKMDVEPLSGNLNEPERIARLAANADAVVHAAFIHNFGHYASSVEAECNILSAITRALAGSGKPMIVTSATGVMGDTGTKVVDESMSPDFTHSLSLRYRAEQAAQAAAKENVRSVVLRLPVLVYGHAGSTFLPMYIESTQKRRTADYVDGDYALCAAHVDDVVAGYLLALEKGLAGETYQLAAESAVPLKDLAEAAGRTLKVPAQAISRDLARETLGDVLGMVFTLNNRASGQKAMDQLGWTPLEGRNLLSDLEQGSYATAFALSGR
jgi:nucleoside-diphosphate-sugar epimerase